jgi:hypothetical protein
VALEHRGSQLRGVGWGTLEQRRAHESAVSTRPAVYPDGAEGTRVPARPEEARGG